MYCQNMFKHGRLHQHCEIFQKMKCSFSYIYFYPLSWRTVPRTRPYTRQHQSRAGGQGQYSSWAGAVTQIWSPFSSKRRKKRSDFRRTDGPTDWLTVTYRVACTRLKSPFPSYRSNSISLHSGLSVYFLVTTIHSDRFSYWESSFPCIDRFTPFGLLRRFKQ